jgi:hypothetical protein
MGDTLLADPPAVRVKPVDRVTDDQLNKVLAGTVLPFTPSTGTVVNGTSVQTVVE